MKNENYNLIKMLHNTLDDLWRVEKYYANDAKESGCSSCEGIYSTLQEDIRKHIDLLTEELGAHAKNDNLK